MISNYLFKELTDMNKQNTQTVCDSCGRDSEAALTPYKDDYGVYMLCEQCNMAEEV